MNTCRKRNKRKKRITITPDCVRTEGEGGGAAEIEPKGSEKRLEGRKGL